MSEIIGRRKFFSFFGAGIALAAGSELWLPYPTRPKDGESPFLSSDGNLVISLGAGELVMTAPAGWSWSSVPLIPTVMDCEIKRRGNGIQAAFWR